MAKVFLWELQPVEDVVRNSNNKWVVQELVKTLDNHKSIKAKVIPLGNYKIFEAEEVEPFEFYDGYWRTGRWVGWVRVGDIDVEIRPRFGWKSLAKMVELISYMTYGASIKGAIPDHIGNVQFLKQLLSILWVFALQQARKKHFGAIKSYVKRYNPENQVYKGWFDFRRQLINNLYGKSHRFACLYSELTYDNPLNQAILYVIHFLRKNKMYPFIPGSGLSWFREEIFKWLENLTALGVKLPERYPELKAKWDRTNGGYKKAYELGKMIVEHKETGTSEVGAFQNILIDTAEVWELFVLWLFRETLEEKGWKVISPRLDNMEDSYAFEVNGRKLVKMVPDIVAEKDKNVLIIDAKCKDISGNGLIPNEDDIRQMLIYLEYYKGDEFSDKKALLVYPMQVGNDFKQKQNINSEVLKYGDKKWILLKNGNVSAGYKKQKKLSWMFINSELDEENWSLEPVKSQIHQELLGKE